MTTNNFTTETQKYLELIFPANVAPADLEIIEPATLARPGRVRLLRPIWQDTATPYAKRLLSTNGRQLIGIVVEFAYLEQLLDGPCGTGYWIVGQDPGDG